MKKLHKSFGLICLCLSIICILGFGNTAQAKKYYSLQDVGLSGCITDSKDYSIISIRGNIVKYAKYEKQDKCCGWKQVGGIQSAKLTSSTKYYIGNGEKVSASLKQQRDKKSNKNNITRKQNTKKKTHLNKKNKNINTEKWIYRARKGTIKKNMGKRNNEIIVSRGKVSKLAVKLTY